MAELDTVQTYYTILEVEEEATAAEVRKAYLRRAAECHPDKHPEDEDATERFQALVEAYECLKDPTSRKSYDLKLLQLRQADSRSSSESPPRRHRESHDARHYHDHLPPPGAFHHHHPHPHLPHRHIFVRATGFSPFLPFPRPPFGQGAGIPAPLAMLSEFMSSFPGRHGGVKGIPGMFHAPFRPEQQKHGPLPPAPFGPMDPFDHPFFRPPFSAPGLAPPPPPPPHFRHLPHPSQRHYHPYPFPPPPPAPLMRPPGTVTPHLPGPPPGLRHYGPGVPGGCHRATYEIRDPAGRTTGFVHHSTMSWVSGFGQ